MAIGGDALLPHQRITIACIMAGRGWPKPMSNRLKASIGLAAELERLVRTTHILLTVSLALGIPVVASAADTVRIDVVKQPYGGERNVPEISMNPDYIQAGGLERLLGEWGGELVRPVQDVRLDAEQDRQYGAWNRMALANSDMASTVREGRRTADLTVGLEANCNVLLGMLAGLQYDADGRKQRVGLVFIDAHGDFNVPETTLSGMLGGMPVAVAAGHALHNIRKTSGLADPLPMSDIVWGGVRDLDPLEADRFHEYEVQQFSVDDIRSLSGALKHEMDDLAKRVDAIYVHIDMDVLDPAEVPGHDLAVANGPGSKDLAAAVTLMFRYPQTVALGIASTPAGPRDPQGVSRQAAFNLIEGAIRGVESR